MNKRLPGLNSLQKSNYFQNIWWQNFHFEVNYSFKESLFTLQHHQTAILGIQDPVSPIYLNWEYWNTPKRLAELIK